MNVRAVLVALGGRGRGRSLTAEGHGVTGLLTVANRPLLQQVADGLAASGVRDVVVASHGSVAAAVRSAVREDGLAGVRIRHVEVPEGAGPLAAVLAARPLLDDGPVVLHGDDSLVLGGMADVMTAFRERDLDALQVATRADPRRRQAGGAIALRPRPQPVGVQILGERALALLGALEAERGAAATLDDLPDAVRRAGGRVGLDDHAAAWRFSGELDSFLEVNRLVLERLAVDAPPVRLDGVDTQGAVMVDPTADVRASRLRGPLLIGPGAVVRDSYVGPHTCIAAGACLEGAEIAYSVVLPEARIIHVGVRIEDSLIGTRARVARTFAMPTALRLHVGAGAQVSLG